MEPTPQNPREFKALHLSMLHVKMNDYFQKHRLSLMKGDLYYAFHFWEQFTSAMTVHFDSEETILFPIILERAPSLRKVIENLTSDHEAVREQFYIISRRLKETSDSNEILDLLDFEIGLKKLIMKHAEQEDQIFYPELDKITTPSEREILFKSVVL
jgi:hemerythrin-like domain-containing protein